jgi:predicted DNA-binding transcriptional regulator YafY
MLKYVDRLKKFDYLVRHSMTGSPKECAKKLEISRSRFYEFLDDLKLMNVPLEYNRASKSYLYTTPGKIHIGFEENLIETSIRALETIKGGQMKQLFEINIFKSPFLMDKSIHNFKIGI